MIRGGAAIARGADGRRRASPLTDNERARRAMVAAIIPPGSRAQVFGEALAGISALAGQALPKDVLDEIVTAAQEPAPEPQRAAEADGRGADVGVFPGKSDGSEKVKAGVRLTSPEPSSGGGHIPGTAGSLAPCIHPVDAALPRVIRDGAPV